MIVKSSQETLAEMIGTTRSHVILVMNKFWILGFIDCASGVGVHGSLLIIVMHNQLEIRDQILMRRVV